MSEQTVDMSLDALTELVERHRRMLQQWEEREQRIDTLISAATRLVGRQVIAENREALDALAELDDSGDYGDFKRQLLRDPATKDAYERRQNVGERSNQLAALGAMLDEVEEWSRQVQQTAISLRASVEKAREMERQPRERISLRTGPMRRCAECGAAEDEPHLRGCTGAEMER